MAASDQILRQPQRETATVRARDDELSITVVVPTYMRAHLLRPCLESLARGDRVPDEVLFVGRESDAATRDMVSQLRAAFSAMRIREAWLAEPGHVPPIRAGARLASSRLVAFIDDDVTVTPGWLGSLVRNFVQPRVGVVGGRVVVPGAPPVRVKGHPGQMTWYGKLWGNVGSVEAAEAFDVASVMEGNWAWRRDLLVSLDFDPRLNVDDASSYGLDLCLQARQKGFRVLYDSQALAYHHVAPRVPELDRADRPRRLFSYTRNFTYIQLKHLRAWRRPFFLGWWLLVGETGAWGVASALADWMFHGFRGRQEVRPALAGKLEGFRLWLRGEG